MVEPRCDEERAVTLRMGIGGLIAVECVCGGLVVAESHLVVSGIHVCAPPHQLIDDGDCTLSCRVKNHGPPSLSAHRFRKVHV